MTWSESPVGIDAHTCPELQITGGPSAPLRQIYLANFAMHQRHHRRHCQPVGWRKRHAKFQALFFEFEPVDPFVADELTSMTHDRGHAQAAFRRLARSKHRERGIANGARSARHRCVRLAQNELE